VKLNSPFKLLASLAILLFIALQIHNLTEYSVIKGFDGVEHIEYINFLKQYRTLPLPDQGWEMYHPPLYYILASVMPGIEYVKLMGYISWLVLGLLCWGFFKRVFNRTESFIATLLVISLPAVIFLTPQISNEFFSDVLISGSLVFYFLNKRRLNRGNSIILGTLLGLSLLSKSTIVVLVAAIVIDQLLTQRFNVITVSRKLLLPLVIALIIGGWFYIRSAHLHGNPLISNLELIGTSTPREPRTPNFWFDLTSVQKLDLFRAHHYSFFGGTYFSFFYDGHNSLIPVQLESQAGSQLVLASLPLFLISILGFINVLRLRRGSIFVIYTALLLGVYIAYLFKYPYHFSVKGFYLLSLAIPWAYYFIYGMRIFNQKFNKFLIFLFLNLALYEALILKNFWILNHWH
jgi:hypothetical protein